MKKLLDLLATHGGVIVCSSSLSPEQITIANACERMYVDENGIGFVYMEEYAQSHANKDGWVSVEERPLFTIDKNGNWECTEDGDKEFIAAVPYNDSKKPWDDLWWIRHCVVEDGTGLCVVGDDDNEPAGWTLEDVTHWQPLPPKPQR